MQYASANYTGDGVDGTTITVGFQSELIIILKVTGGVWSWRSSAMSGDVSLRMDGTLTLTDRIQSITATGFTLGTSADVNTNGASYRYIAFGADSDILKVGTYTGDGLDGKIITTTLTPVFAFVQDGGGAVGDSGVFRNATQVGDLSFSIVSALGATANRIQTLDAGGFTVGTASTVNTLNGTYYYFAFAANTDQISQSSYIGNNADDRDITTSPAIQPVLVWIKRQSTANNNTACMRIESIAGDNVNKVTSGEQSNAIQAANTNGFQVGTDYVVNGNDGGGDSVNTYFYLTIAAPAASTLPALPTLPAGSFSMPGFSPYKRYKSIREVVQAINHLSFGP